MPAKLPLGHRRADHRIESRCDRCGQTDDDPKVHLSTGETHHFDCAGDETSVAVLDAAEGRRGSALAEFLQQQGKD